MVFLHMRSAVTFVMCMMSSFAHATEPQATSASARIAELLTTYEVLISAVLASCAIIVNNFISYFNVKKQLQSQSEKIENERLNIIENKRVQICATSTVLKFEVEQLVRQIDQSIQIIEAVDVSQNNINEVRRSLMLAKPIAGKIIKSNLGAGIFNEQESLLQSLAQLNGVLEELDAIINWAQIEFLELLNSKDQDAALPMVEFISCLLEECKVQALKLTSTLDEVLKTVSLSVEKSTPASVMR